MTESAERGARNTGNLGRTTIADGVVAKIAYLAAAESDGVHALGSGFSRSVGALRKRVPGGGTTTVHGVKVEVGEKQAAVDLDLVVDYGEVIPEVGRAVRRNVISAVEVMTGLQVVEVNIAVSDVWLPEDEEEERVQ
ncbi:Asp23/Gls24 family envelope stress response protein [Streptomyces lydicus]|uniref:Asp23/Gls24 family envelope stress response protein n=1 Tax=Streptomyces lydicus TaxID=47763 RepID=UPI0010124D11|nr:Asp23/Gls24 family envelope stress response protein [Streptomyces lydicus]MCZ1011285.1 Asp23/Gls24 family envelope stress response protein [Streptomyces lydicus]